MAKLVAWRLSHRREIEILITAHAWETIEIDAIDVEIELT